jgi:sugar/nucleoside kinase (ribokinase family)
MQGAACQGKGPAVGEGWREVTRDLLISGHVNIDRFLQLETFPDPDRTVPVLSGRTELGGTATNQALVAARLGVRVGLVARVGDGFPDEFRARLDKAGIDLRGLVTLRGRRTPTCYIVEDRRGGQRTLIDQGAMARDPRARLPGAWIGEYAWLHLTTGDPDFQLRLATRGRSQGLRIAADPAQEVFYRWTSRKLRRLLGLSEILFGNRAELAYVARLLGRRTTEELLDVVPLVVRTEGAQGATAYSRAARTVVRSRRARRQRSLVGAGDAFRGGFYAAWLAGSPIRACLEGGARAATRWIEHGA